MAVTIPDPLTEENSCRNCHATGLVPGEVPKYRRTCPVCHGFRRNAHNPETCSMCKPKETP